MVAAIDAAKRICSMELSSDDAQLINQWWHLPSANTWAHSRRKMHTIHGIMAMTFRCTCAGANESEEPEENTDARGVTLQLSSLRSMRVVSTPPLARVSAAHAPPGPPPMTATRRGLSSLAPSLTANTCVARGRARLRLRADLAVAAMCTTCIIHLQNGKPCENGCVP